MILKEIELNGFKSFKEKTKLTFDTDVVAIVGPNGAGKSNIVDAIKWLLGEQSNREIRTTDSAGLIFANPEEKDRIDVCSVAITLEALHPIEHWQPGTYRVEKRYYRDEESEYLINGDKARLKDIRALLAGMGVGLDNLAIVSQGEIGTFLSLIPTDRRIVFEEIAQLGNFKSNKRRILNDLTNMGRNLERLEDNLSDRRTRLTQLSEQAAIARRFTNHNEELKYCTGNLLALDLILTERNIARYNTRVEENNILLVQFRETITGHTAEISSSESNLDLLRTHREEALLASARYRSEVESKRHNLEKAELEIKHKRDTLQELQAALTERQERKDKFEEDKARIESRIDELKIKIQSGKDDEVLAFDANQQKMSSIKSFQVELESNEKEYDEYRKQLEDESRAHTLVESTLKSLRETTAGIEKNRDELNLRTSGLGQTLSRQKDEVTILVDEIRAMELEKGLAEGRRDTSEEELHAARQNQSDLLREESSRAGELSGFERLEREREGLGAGVKAILDERDKTGKFKGIIGVLSDLIQVKPGYELALEAVIGGKLRNLVSETKDDAIAAINWVKKEEAGEISVIPLDEIHPFEERPVSGLKEGDSGYLFRAIDALEYDPRLEPAIRYAVGGALVVKDLTSGLDIRRKYHATLKMVTPDGDLIYPAGVLRGGRAKHAVTGLLVRKARIETLRDELGGIRKKLEKSALDILEADRRRKSASMEISHIDASLADTRGRKSSADIVCGITNAALEEIQGRLLELDGRSMEGLKRSEELMTEATALAVKIESLRETERNQKESIIKLRESIETETLEFHRDKSRLESLRLHIATDEEEIERHHADIKARTVDESRADFEIAQREKRIEETEQEITASEQVSDGLRKEIIDLEDGFPTVANRERELEDEINDKKALIEKLENEKTDAEAKVAELDDDIHKSEIKLATLESEHKSLVEKLSAEYPKVYDDFNAGQLAAKDFGAKGDLKEKIESLEKEIAELGEINHLAIAEYDTVKEEISFKEGQRDDLLQSRVELEKSLAEIDKKSREVFMEVFEETNRHFGDVFKRLFPGGHAAVALTDPSDPLESGIDIRARFPGKKEIDIIQFSGGEKAIVALVLLFAILRVKPSSFTVLDEVEAALDDINVDNFLTLVNDFLPDRQFIIITHNKGTMQFARRLYGVTMRKDGISRIVSVNLTEWDEAVLGARTGTGLDDNSPHLKKLPRPKSN